MKVVQIIGTFKLGGAQTLQATFAREALRRRLDFEIICLSEPMGTQIEAELRELNVPLTYLPGKSLFDLKRLNQLTGLLKDSRADVVQAHLTYANILGAIAARRVGLPVVATLHNTQPDPGWDHWVRFQLETIVLNLRAHKVIAVAHQIADAHEKRFSKKKLVAVLNAVEMAPRLAPEEREAARAEMTGDPTRLICLTAGRIALQKALPDLLHAFAEVHRRHPEAALVIAGDGHERSQVDQVVQELGLDEDVFMLGVRNDVRRLMSASDIYVSSSHWEGLPISILEAMATGLPVLATRVGDLPYVVIDGTGCLVPPGEPDTLAKELNRLIEIPELRREMGQAAREHVTRHYLPKPWVDQTLKVYAEACLEAGHPCGAQQEES